MATVRRVLAPNPSPYTGPGTNTWILGEDPAVIVIDPGPDDEQHLRAIEARIGSTPVGAILVTHSHPDHLPLAAKLAERTGARVRRWPDLADGDVVRVGKLNLTSLFTPGHAPDHLSFWMEDDQVLFTGDLILGRGSSLVTYPEGDVAAYLRSLERVAALRPRMLFPGHWDPVSDAGAKIEEYRTHRLAREQQVVEAMRGAAVTPEELTRRVYAEEVGDSEALLRGAEMTLRAHLRKLVDDGRVRVRTEGSGEVYELVS